MPIWSGKGDLPPNSAGHHVFLTPDRHTILVRLPQESPNVPPRVVSVPIHNDFRPSLANAVYPEPSNLYRYEYRLSNGRDAKDDIGALSLIVPAGDSSLRVPADDPPGSGWAGAPAHVAVAKQPLFSDLPLGQYVLWVRRKDLELKPGKSLDPLLVRSTYKPGLSAAWAASINPPDFDQSWPREVFEQLEKLEDRQWREKYMITAAPMFPPDTPSIRIVKHLSMAVPELAKHALIDRATPFIIDLESVLQEVVNTGAVDPKKHAISVRPRSEVERAIASVLRTSLGIKVP
ncbi:MAG: hypothetical protein HYX27_06255 [Acidobacteria bacterium]|nr:hypothetical protein [Acidobacteriota bacterium]